MSTTSVNQIDRATNRRRLMTPDELAEYLGVSLHCVYAWSSRGGGPNVVRVGRPAALSARRRRSVAGPRHRRPRGGLTDASQAHRAGTLGADPPP